MNMFRCQMLLFVVLVACLCCEQGTAMAEGAPLPKVVAALEGGYAILKDVQADFAQRTTIASMNREERGGGELFIKRQSGSSGMFRFNYTKPKQQIVSNGKTVWYYLPDNKQVMVAQVSAMFSGGNAVALNYLTGLGQVSRDFTVTFAGDGRDRKGNYLLDLVPKKPSPVMAKLQLTLAAEAVDHFVATGISRDPFPIVASVLTDMAGNRTAIDFSKVKTNQGLGSDRFTFKIPAGVEVIKQ